MNSPVFFSLKTIEEAANILLAGFKRSTRTYRADAESETPFKMRLIYGSVPNGSKTMPTHCCLSYWNEMGGRRWSRYWI